MTMEMEQNKVRIKIIQKNCIKFHLKRYSFMKEIFNFYD